LKNKITVIIAEDEAIVRLDLKEMLTAQGFEVVGEASRGDQAIELVKERKPDLVILDIKMPGVDGIKAAEEIGTLLDKPAILFLTAFSQRDLIEKARDAGAMAYLIKPFQENELLPAIEIALARHAEVLAAEAYIGDLVDEKDKLEAKVEFRKLLDRTKGKLMDEFDMGEAQAFRFIQKSAMDRRVKMDEICNEVISGNLTPEK
jgi:response regulator NasT